MTHDKVKAEARKRMAETGEPYALARRKVIEEHARRQAERSGTAAAAAVDATETAG